MSCCCLLYTSLENIESYAKQVKLESHIQTCHTDSLEGVIKLLPSLSQSSFLHIDPYEIDKKGISGTTYLDVLIQDVYKRQVPSCVLAFLPTTMIYSTVQ